MENQTEKPQRWLTEDEIELMIARHGISPATRRLIIACLFLTALVCILAEVWLAYLGQTTSDALMAIAASAVGAIGGMAAPQQSGPEK